MGGVAFSSPQKCGIRGALHLIGEVTFSLMTCCKLVVCKIFTLSCTQQLISTDIWICYTISRGLTFEELYCLRDC